MNRQSLTVRRADRPDDVTEKERRGRRMDLSCRVFFFGPDDFEGEASLVDLSTGGCQISTAETIPVGASLKLSLFLPDHKWPMRVDEVIVRWAQDGRYGVEFTSIRLAQRERLRALVMKSKV
jgi:c-di-GMP-binding flagellar brake protein YcgR